MHSSYKLKNCVWEITLACCFSCKYCGSGGGRKRENELTTEECLDVAGQLAALGCQRVSLIGGEVFLRSDWEEIVGTLTASEIRTSIITNGFLFSEELISVLKKLNVESVAVSLDGPECIHDACRQTGSYQRAANAIQMLVKEHFPVSVISTLHSGNVPYLEELFCLLEGWNIDAWQLQACSPMGNAVRRKMDYRFDSEAVIAFLESHMFSAAFPMGIADNIGYFSKNEGYLRGNLSGLAVFPGCSAGLTSIGIDSIGNVRGCESMYDDRFIEGNLRSSTLKELWESPSAFTYNRGFQTTMLEGDCHACRYGSRCAGGCRSYNYFVHGKLYESPSCVRISSLQHSEKIEEES